MVIPRQNKPPKEMSNKELLKKKNELLKEIREIENAVIKCPDGWKEDESIIYSWDIDYLVDIIKEINNRVLLKMWLWDQNGSRSLEENNERTQHGRLF